MAKRNWKDHPAVGRTISIQRGNGDEECKVVDVKCGPMMVDTSTFDQPEAKIIGTLKLCIKPTAGGSEFWTPPVEGEALLKWCEQQDTKESRP